MLIYIYINICIHVYVYVSSGWQKLALSGPRHSGEWWALPTLPEWAWAPDRCPRVAKLGPWPDTCPSSVCVCLGCRNFVLFGGLAAKIPAASFGWLREGFLGLRPRVSRCSVAHVELPTSTSESWDLEVLGTTECICVHMYVCMYVYTNTYIAPKRLYQAPEY